MAYHLLVASLESLKSPKTAHAAFAYAVGSALKGYESFDRFHAAGHAASLGPRLTEARLAAAVASNMALDLNPIARCLTAARSVEGILAVHRGIHKLSAMSVTTELAIKGAAMVVTKRFSKPGMADPTLCKDAHLAAVDIVVGRVPSRRPRQDVGKPAAAEPAFPAITKVSDVADRLGLGFGAAAELAMAFEANPALDVGGAARHLGCHPRTLQRELRAAGARAGWIKQATMLNAATGLLPSTLTLTEIAHQAGYADQAHMTRAFVSSCGLPPSLLRKAFA